MSNYTPTETQGESFEPYTFLTTRFFTLYGEKLEERKLLPSTFSALQVPEFSIELFPPIISLEELQASLPPIEVVTTDDTVEEQTTEELLDELLTDEEEPLVEVTEPEESVTETEPSTFEDHAPVFVQDDTIVINEDKPFEEYAAEQVNEHQLDEFIHDLQEEPLIEEEPEELVDFSSDYVEEEEEAFSSYDAEISDFVEDDEIIESQVEEPAPVERVVEREVIREYIVVRDDQEATAAPVIPVVPAPAPAPRPVEVVSEPALQVNAPMFAEPAEEETVYTPEPARTSEPVTPAKPELTQAEIDAKNEQIRQNAARKAEEAFHAERTGKKKTKPARGKWSLFGRKEQEETTEPATLPQVNSKPTTDKAVASKASVVEEVEVQPLRVQTDDYVAPTTTVTPAEEKKSAGLFKKKATDRTDENGVNPQKWLETTIYEALSRNASDLHISMAGDKNSLTARIRVDGIMTDMDKVEGVNARIIMGRLKAATNLSSAGSFEPEETIYEIELDGEKRKARAVIFRTHDDGEALVMRLPLTGPLKELEELNFSRTNLDHFYELLASPSKLIMIAGPMGSGKTTTAHGAMLHVATDERTVWTIEDPVERNLPGAVQLEIDEENGAGFGVLLSKLLRADYNTLFLGEIRDHATAAAGVRQAKAGRQVMSTIHANNNVTALLRLIELADDSALSVLDSVRGVVSQRLVRRLNPDWDGVDVRSKYKGRLPIHEVLFVDDNLIEVMMQNKPLTEIKKAAAEAVGSTFAEDCQRLLEAGLTDEEEIRRVIGDNH